MASEEVIVSRVTRKGQVTIPAEFRRSHNIKEGGKVVFSSKKKGELMLTSFTSLADLAGVDSKKISYKEAVKRLDRMRENDRY